MHTRPSGFVFLLLCCFTTYFLVSFCSALRLSIDADTPGALAASVGGAGVKFLTPKGSGCGNLTASAETAFLGTVNEATELLAVALISSGLDPSARITNVYLVVDAMATGSNGVEVFSVDVLAGSFVWNQPYFAAGKTFPAGTPAVYDLWEIYQDIGASQGYEDALINDPLEFRINFVQGPAVAGVSLQVRCFRLVIDYTLPSTTGAAAVATTRAGTTNGFASSTGSRSTTGLGSSTGDVSGTFAVTTGSSTTGNSVGTTDVSAASTGVSPQLPTDSTTSPRLSTGPIVGAVSSTASSSDAGLFVGIVAGAVVALLLVVGAVVAVIYVRRGAMGGTSTGISSSRSELVSDGHPSASAGQYHNASSVVGDAESSAPVGEYHNVPSANSETAYGEVGSVAEEPLAAGQYHNIPAETSS
jgi:hypothetical protein